MPAGAEGIAGLALIKQDCGLTVTHGQLRAEFDLAGALFGQSMHQFFTGLIKPLDVFEKYSAIKSVHTRLFQHGDKLSVKRSFPSVCRLTLQKTSKKL